MPVTILIDCILLLLLESKVNLVNDSTDTIASLLVYYDKVNTRWNVDDDSINMKLVTMIRSLISTIEEGNKIDVERTIRILKVETATNNDFDGDSDLKDLILEMISSIDNLNTDDTYTTIDSLKSSIYELYNTERIKKLMQSKTIELNKRGHSITYKNLLSSLRESLDKMEEGSSSQDDAIMNEIDLSDMNNEKKLKELESSVVTKHIFRTGWKGINRMIQGGIRVPEYRSIAALTHNFKSGFALSMFASIVLYNKPKPTKDKPLAVYFSLEDDIVPIFEFLYRLIHITETGKVLTDMKMNTSELIKYVGARLQAKGFNVKIIRINPTEWSYAALINKIKKYISQGYDVQLVDIDYLEKLPTTGIDSSGPTGYDKKVLIRKVRNFMASIGASSGTPWQLAPKASDLKKDGLSELDFLPFVSNKQYYQGSSTLGNEMDLEFFTNVIDTNDNGSWLNVHIGKHKIPTIVEKKYKNYYLPFPSDGPIPFDVDLSTELGSYDIKTPNPFY